MLSGGDFVMPMSDIPQPAPVPLPPVAYPPWMDGRYMTATCQYRFTKVAITGGHPNVIMAADVRRWCFWLTTYGGVGVSISLYNDLMDPNSPMTYNLSVFPVQLTLFTWGSAINRIWYTTVGNPPNLGVHELLAY